MKRFAIFPLVASFCSFGSTFQCESKFAWLKSTFENNDAGFQYTVENKGLDLYSAHNSAILARVQSAKSEAQCHTVLSDWLTFFRKGHVGLGLNTNDSEQAVRESVVHDFDLSAFKQYLKSKRDETLEGIWQFSSYRVALKQEGNVHKAYIVESTNPSWKAGQVKFIINDPALQLNQKFAYSPHGH